MGLLGLHQVNNNNNNNNNDDDDHEDDDDDSCSAGFSSQSVLGTFHEFISTFHFFPFFWLY